MLNYWSIMYRGLDTSAFALDMLQELAESGIHQCAYAVYLYNQMCSYNQISDLNLYFSKNTAHESGRQRSFSSNLQ